MRRRRDHLIGSMFLIGSVAVPGIIFCSLAMYSSGHLDSWAAAAIGAIFPTFLLVGACFLFRAEGHSWTVPFKPWRWSEFSDKSAVRELPRERALPVVPLGGPLEAEAQQADGGPLQYARPPVVSLVTNRPLPPRVFLHTFKDALGFCAMVLAFGAIGVFAAMRKAQTSPPREHVWAVEAAFGCAVLLTAFAAARTLRRFRHAFVVSARVMRIARGRHNANAVVDAEYSIDAAAIAARFAMPALDAGHLAPGEHLDLIVIPGRLNRPLYDLHLAQRLHRYGDSQPSAANRRLRRDPVLRGKRGQQAIVGGMVLIGFGIWQGMVLADFDRHGGQVTVWGPVAILHGLFGTEGTIAIFLVLGTASLLYGLHVLSDS